MKIIIHPSLVSESAVVMKAKPAVRDPAKRVYTPVAAKGQPLFEYKSTFPELRQAVKSMAALLGCGKVVRLGKLNMFEASPTERERVSRYMFEFRRDVVEAKDVEGKVDQYTVNVSADLGGGVWLRAGAKFALSTLWMHTVTDVLRKKGRVLPSWGEPKQVKSLDQVVSNLTKTLNALVKSTPVAKVKLPAKEIEVEKLDVFVVKMLAKLEGMIAGNTPWQVLNLGLSKLASSVAVPYCDVNDFQLLELHERFTRKDQDEPIVRSQWNVNYKDVKGAEQSKPMAISVGPKGLSIELAGRPHLSFATTLKYNKSITSVLR